MSIASTCSAFWCIPFLVSLSWVSERSSWNSSVESTSEQWRNVHCYWLEFRFGSAGENWLSGSFMGCLTNVLRWCSQQPCAFFLTMASDTFWSAWVFSQVSLSLHRPMCVRVLVCSFGFPPRSWHPVSVRGRIKKIKLVFHAKHRHILTAMMPGMWMKIVLSLKPFPMVKQSKILVEQVVPLT